MSDTLKAEVAKISYDMLLKNQPAMIKVIGEALDSGQSISQLSRFAKKRGSSLVAGLIEQAALYMKQTGTR